jgi:kynurenine formamidase
VAGRGLLLDAARHLGVDWLDDNHSVSPELLDEIVERQGVRLRSGDIVLVRTGRVGKAIREDGFRDKTFAAASPGLSVRCASWLVDHDVAAVAADNIAVEVTRWEAEGAVMPMHMICQRDAGIIFGELLDLESLSVACAEALRWEFLFVAAPIPISGAVGSPINPLAIL